ncbi:MAG: hypothetical protein HYS23_11810 [Geobacter sp.]|nr:hypothetical protein [Geobacter sp.]
MAVKGCSGMCMFCRQSCRGEANSLLVSAIDGRIRLRDARFRNPQVSERAECLLRGNSAVRHACCNQRTGSLLVEYDAKAAGEATILAMLAPLLNGRRPAGRVYAFPDVSRADSSPQPVPVAEAA